MRNRKTVKTIVCENTEYSGELSVSISTIGKGKGDIFLVLSDADGNGDAVKITRKQAAKFLATLRNSITNVKEFRKR